MRHRTAAEQSHGRRAFCTGLLGLPVVLLAGCAAPVRIDASSQAAWADSLERLRLRHGLPALAAALLDGDGSVAAATGVRRHGTPDPVALDDALHVGSLAKPVTATMIATLLAEGVLDWRSTPLQVFPELTGALHPRLAHVTLRQLLGHRAGLDAYTSRAQITSVPAFDGGRAAQRAAFTAHVLSRPPARAPGRHTLYSNAGPAVAAAMAERASGHDWESLVRERVFEPLGMHTAGFGWPALAEPDAPWGHFATAEGPLPHDPTDGYRLPAWLAPASDVHMSIGDLARFARLHLHGLTGRPVPVLDAARIAELHEPLADHATPGWGHAELGGAPASQHTGSAGTFTAYVAVVPSRDRALAVVASAGETAADPAQRALVGRLLR